MVKPKNKRNRGHRAATSLASRGAANTNATPTPEQERRTAALTTRARRMEIVAIVQADERTVLKELRAPGSCKGSVGERIREYLATGKLAERAPQGVAS